MSSKLSALVTSNPVLAAALTKSAALYLYDPAQSGSDQSAAVILHEIIKALFSYAASTNASGNTTITPGAVNGEHVEVTTISGTGSTTRILVLATSNAPTAGARITNRVSLPATADITIEWRNATSGGTLITSLITDGSGDDGVFEFYYDGSAWQLLRPTYPANA